MRRARRHSPPRPRRPLGSPSVSTALSTDPPLEHRQVIYRVRPASASRPQEGSQRRPARAAGTHSPEKRVRHPLRSSAEQVVVGEPKGTPAEDQPRRVDLRCEERGERRERDERRDGLDQRSSAQLPRDPRHERQRGHVRPVQEASQYRGIAQARDDGPGEDDEDEARKEDPDGGEEGPRDPGENVSDESCRGEDRPRRDLPYGHGVEQLLVRQEPGVNELGPQEGQKHVTAAKEYRPDLQKRHEDAQRTSEGGGGRE